MPIKSKCSVCKFWNRKPTNENQDIPHRNFGYCSGIKIHDGGSGNSKYCKENVDIAPLDANVVICVSEWLLNFQTHTNFCCRNFIHK
jgi:hypothetical protein